jgi:hypothetical protein
MKEGNLPESTEKKENIKIKNNKIRSINFRVWAK